MAFQGYLFRAAKEVNGSTVYADPFPLRYMEESSWDSAPNQREEIKAYRDDNTRNLTRVTASGMKSAFSFETRENLHLADKQAIQTYFTSYESDSTQRKIKLKYWNDDINDYKEGIFYRPNMNFKIKKVIGNDIIYDSLKIEFVEY